MGLKQDAEELNLRGRAKANKSILEHAEEDFN